MTGAPELRYPRAADIRFKAGTVQLTPSSYVSPCPYSLRPLAPFLSAALLAAFVCAPPIPALAAPLAHSARLAPTPPMGWNDWAHYQCGYTAQTILDNAHSLVTSGLAAAGYNTVTIDDCWMQKDRDASGNLQADAQRFPQGMRPVAQAVHALGLKFGIYEDSGAATCGGWAGSGEPMGGGKTHFLQDARLFASWGVDYLKLDGCSLYIPQGSTKVAVYRRAYAEESAALKAVGRPIVFSESAPAYFQGTPDWYDVLTWVRGYGQLWREGSDMANFHAADSRRPRFQSVLWNYAYNLPLGRFQKPGNWNDPDFIIGGDGGMSLAESRSQLALWSMMSAPLILSSDAGKLAPEARAILGNRAVIRIDQDPLGRMATLLRRRPDMDVLLKKLSGGDYAVAVLNRGTSPVQVSLSPAELGFAAATGCTLDAQDLWTGVRLADASLLQAGVAGHDTAIWRVHPSRSCGTPSRSGTVTMITTGKHRDIDSYTRCLAAPGLMEDCAGTPEETWTIGARGELKSAGQCLTAVHGKAEMRTCTAASAQHWGYTLAGNLIGAEGKCLTAANPGSPSQGLTLQPCGHNAPQQIWSLPN